MVLLALGTVLPVRGGLVHAQAGAARPARPAKPGPAAAPDPAAVEQRLREAVRQHPDSFKAHHMLAVFYLQRGRVPDAIPLLRRAQAIDPSDYVSGYDLAVALLETGDVAGAREQASRMLQAKPTGELHNLLGDIEERGGRLEAAAEQYERAARLEPSEEHLFDWANNLLQLGARQPAVEVFTAAIARHPRSARLHVGLGIARYSQGAYADAVKALCDAVDLAPTDPRPYQFLGEVYGVAPELEGEITARLARFVKAQPRNALAHLHYALSLWKGSRSAATAADLRRVESLLRRAVGLDPRLARGFLELGILLSDQQRYTEAIPELRRAAELDPANPQPHYRLARAYQSTGQRELAAKELEIFERLKATSR